MLRAAAKAYFCAHKEKEDSFSKRLNCLINECLEFSNRRNEIAHGRVVMIYVENIEKDQLG